MDHKGVVHVSTSGVSVAAALAAAEEASSSAAVTGFRTGPEDAEYSSVDLYVDTCGS